MDVFRNAEMSVQYPENIHPHRRDPKQTLKRFKKAMRTREFRAGDEAWILVDIDNWDQNDIENLLRWANEDSRHHAAISNPKFELFLIMHFERGNGCTTPQAVDAALKRHMPRYSKRLPNSQFRRDQITEAVKTQKQNTQAAKRPFPPQG